MAVLKDLVVIGPARVTGPSYANSFVKAGGTSSQFLKADGSVDSNSYALATSIPTVNNATLTIAASGLTLSTDPTFTANASAAKTITITHPTATAYSSGFYKVTVNGTGHVTAATAVTASDITSLVTIPSFAALGSGTKPVYLSAADTFSQCSQYAGGTAVTLNGTSKAASTASFYAPTAVGASGQFLKSNGSGAPTWTNVINTDYVLVNKGKPTSSLLKLNSVTPYTHADYSFLEVYIPETITATGPYTFETNHSNGVTAGNVYFDGSNTHAPQAGYYHGYLNYSGQLYLYNNGFLPAKGFIVPEGALGYLMSDGSIDTSAPGGGASQDMATAVAQYNSSASTTGKAIYTATVSNVQRNAIFIYIDSTEYTAHFNASTQLWIDLNTPIMADNYVFVRNFSGHTLNFTSTNITSSGTVPDYILYPEDNNGDNPLDDDGIIDMRTTLIGITFLDNQLVSTTPIAVVTFGGRFNEIYPNNSAS